MAGCTQSLTEGFRKENHMSEHHHAKGHDQKRRSKGEAIHALYFAVVGAIETAPEALDAPLEVSCTGISLDVVNAVIAKFDHSGWNVALKTGEHTLTISAENVDNSHTPRPPRPPYAPPQPIVPTPPIQPVYEPGPNPPPTNPGPTPGTIPPVVPPGREPNPNPNPAPTQKTSSL